MLYGFLLTSEKLKVVNTKAAMKTKNEALKVLELTSRLLKAGVITQKPAWFDIISAHPPSLDVTKTPKSLELHQEADPLTTLFVKQSGFYKTRACRKDVKQKNSSLFRIPKLELFEDELRDVFYHQHPWELSRPKIIVETTGTDAEKCDWSHMLQLLKPLDGESVVQRTIWLLKKSKENGEEKSLFEAYDEARFEFYQLRMAEEMDSVVAREESGMVGAVYPSTHFTRGVEKEQPHVDRWTECAELQTRYLNASRNSVSSSVGSMVSDQFASIWETSLSGDLGPRQTKNSTSDPLPL